MTLHLDHDAFWGPDVAYWEPAISLSDRWCLQALVSPGDVEWARQWLWCHTYGSGSRLLGSNAQKCYNKIYARRCTRIGGVAKTIFLHREITERAYGPPPSPLHVSDHLDGDSLNCRRDNLRWATLSQNAHNRFGSYWLQHRFDL